LTLFERVFEAPAQKEACGGSVAGLDEQSFADLFKEALKSPQEAAAPLPQDPPAAALPPPPLAAAAGSAPPAPQIAPPPEPATPPFDEVADQLRAVQEAAGTSLGTTLESAQDAASTSISDALDKGRRARFRGLLSTRPDAWSQRAGARRAVVLRGHHYPFITTRQSCWWSKEGRRFCNTGTGGA
jgi:hypothetical protein